MTICLTWVKKESRQELMRVFKHCQSHLAQIPLARVNTQAKILRALGISRAALSNSSRLLKFSNSFSSLNILSTVVFV